MANLQQQQDTNSVLSWPAASLLVAVSSAVVVRERRATTIRQIFWSQNGAPESMVGQLAGLGKLTALPQTH